MCCCGSDREREKEREGEAININRAVKKVLLCPEFVEVSLTQRASFHTQPGCEQADQERTLSEVHDKRIKRV